MRSVRTNGSLVALACAALAVAVPSISAADYPAVAYTRLEAQRHQAMIEADVEALDRLLADQCTYTHSTGLVQSKAELIAMLTSGDVRYLSIETTDVAGADYRSTVVVTGEQTIELEVDGKPVTSVSRYTVVWALVGESWQCIAYQSTEVPEREGD